MWQCPGRCPACGSRLAAWRAVLRLAETCGLRLFCRPAARSEGPEAAVLATVRPLRSGFRGELGWAGCAPGGPTWPLGRLVRCPGTRPPELLSASASLLGVFGSLDPKLPVRKSVDLHSPSAVGAEYHLRLPCFQLLLQAESLSKLLSHN
jgi:hypothetical protein